MLNQTDRLTRVQAQKGLGARLKLFTDLRKRYDPNNRLLNDFFRSLLAERCLSVFSYNSADSRSSFLLIQERRRTDS